MRTKDVLGHIGDMQNECIEVLEQATHPVGLNRYSPTMKESYTASILPICRDTIDALDTLIDDMLKDIYTLEEGDAFRNLDYTEEGRELCAQMKLDPDDAGTPLAVRQREIFLAASDKIFSFNGAYLAEALKIKKVFDFRCGLIDILYMQNISTRN